MQESTSQKPFLFEQSFDLAAMKAAEEKKVAPTFNEQELAHAREQAYGQGFVAGKEAALREMQQQQNSVLGVVQTHIEAIGQNVWQVLEQQRKAAIDVAMTIVRRVVPDYLKRHGQQEVIAAIESGVAEMINEPRLVLRIHENNFDFINREVGEMVKRLGFAGKMIILSDNTLGENDCRLEWADGGMERQSDAIWNELEKQVAKHTHSPHATQQKIPLQDYTPTHTTDQSV